ncbi:MAG: hypothetical protein HOP20_04195 [Sulfuriferula sp.]|nr:hypothetical protein [Sulfuriferula sp.]
MSTWKDPLGSNRIGLWLADRNDRKRNNIARIAARWGWLKPMGERGKVVWVMAGASTDSVRLAVELVRAIREKRLDIRLVLTFEHDDPSLLTALDDCDKTGWGLSPCDHPRALARAMERLSPYGIIVVGAQPRPNLSALLNQQARVLTVNPPQTVTYQCERIYNGTGKGETAPVADMLARLAHAQIDPNFKSLVNHGVERHLWWLHGDTQHHLSAQFKQQASNDVLFVSGTQPAIAHLAISSWDRSPIAGGTVVWIDDAKWLPAISAAVTATHLVSIDNSVLWQAMAGGAAISCAQHDLLPKAELNEAITAIADPSQLWQDYRDNPILARQRGDSARRLFWQERRLAESVSAELVERVFEW